MIPSIGQSRRQTTTEQGYFPRRAIRVRWQFKLRVEFTTTYSDNIKNVEVIKIEIHLPSPEDLSFNK